MAPRPSPSESYVADNGAAARWFRSGMQLLRPVSEAAVSLGHDSVWENQRRISDNGLDMPHWRSNYDAKLGYRGTALHAPSDNKSGPLHLSGYLKSVDALHGEGDRTGPSRKRHQSLHMPDELVTMMTDDVVSDDDIDENTGSDAQLTLKTSMAELRLKELTEKASLIEKVSNG